MRKLRSHDPDFWLRDLLHKLQPSIREWWCAPPVEVIRTGTFLYFVDELRLVRHTRRPEESQVTNLDYSVPSDDVIEALP